MWWGFPSKMGGFPLNTRISAYSTVFCVYSSKYGYLCCIMCILCRIQVYLWNTPCILRILWYLTRIWEQKVKRPQIRLNTSKYTGDMVFTRLLHLGPGMVNVLGHMLGHCGACTRVGDFKAFGECELMMLKLAIAPSCSSLVYKNKHRRLHLLRKLNIRYQLTAL